MVNLSQKIITLFSLLFFLQAGISPALCALNSAGDSGSAPPSLSAATQDDQVGAVSAEKNKENSASHKNTPALKQRLRGKRSTPSLSTIDASVTLTSTLPSLLFPGHLYHGTTSAWQKPSLRYLRTVVLLI